MAAFDFSTIAQCLGSPERAPVKVLGFRQNSQEITPGDLFFAMKGERVDGHSFLAEAKQRGAVAAVISREYKGERYGLACVEVEDVLKSLHALAASVCKERKARIIGVTGSVGKTTTKEFIATLLEKKFRTTKTPGNANSQVGVPLSLLNASSEREVFVMEMGMSSPKELEKLVQIAPPEIAVVTKIALSHVAYFSDGLEGIAAAKAEIFSHPATQIGIVNRQVLSFQAFASLQNVSLESYSLSQGGELFFSRREEEFSLVERGVTTPTFSLPFSASHLCENFLAAALVARKMGLSWEEIFERAHMLTPYKNRFELVEKGGVTYLNDSYNANPTSMRAALENLPCPKQGGRVLAVLGAMKELGKFSEAGHEEMASLALNLVDHLICLGKECAPMVKVFQEKGRSVEFCQTLSDVKESVKRWVQPCDVVLLKGSNSNQLWKVLE